MDGARGLKRGRWSARRTVGEEWRWMTGGGLAEAKGGAEGERANARSVTPHCAHLPTRPTPKFELGSQPHRFSSTRLPSSSPVLASSSPTRPSTLFTVNVRGEMSALSPRTSACTTSISLLFLSRSRFYSRREQSVEEYPLKRVACLSSSCGNRYQCHRRLASRVSYPSITGTMYSWLF